jgi:hypothetical protein
MINMGLAALPGVGAVALAMTISCRGASEMRDRGVEVRPRTISEQSQVRSEDLSTIGNLIARQRKFAICKSYNLDFEHFSDSHPYCNISKNSSGPQLRLLSTLNYISSPASQYGFDFHLGEYLPWCPTAKGESAIGAQIEQERLAPPVARDPTWSQYHEGKEPDMSRYRWTVVLGCRRFMQIDTAAALADGWKVDFSWQWHPTDFGIREGMNDMRQRGEAYFHKGERGLEVEQIYFHSN